MNAVDSNKVSQSFTRRCQGCGVEFSQPRRRGRPRAYCTNECRLDHPDAARSIDAARTERTEVALTPERLERVRQSAERADMSPSAWIAELIEDTFALEDADDEIVRLVEDVDCPPFHFEIERFDGLLFVRAKMWRRDIHTGEMGWGYSARYLVRASMDRGEIVKKCFVAARDFSEHEVREGFKYRGRAILGPHIDIDRLWTVAPREIDP